MIFFIVRRSFHRKNFKWKKYGGTGQRSEKTEALHAGLNERVEAAANSYSAEVGFLQYLEDPIKMFSLWIFLHKHF